MLCESDEKVDFCTWSNERKRGEKEKKLQKRKNCINMEKLWSQGIEKHCTVRASFLCVFRKWKEKKGKRELTETTKGKKEKEERKEGRKRERGRRKQRKNSLQSFSWHLISSVSPIAHFKSSSYRHNLSIG